ncbi:uncharacterized protein [Drosophila pseudoobscura]|uniref:Uncharacterized protein n=1 Tax=Drosophila pseudoobscura pseudoobscura TaxID=46245 RepID=A0A6I8V387_DROPS|nr:uncharacterized protein LOC6897525 [Drosophila pseudoobscura]
MLPFSSRKTLQVLSDLESKAEDAAVNEYGNNTRAWRNQYKNPNLARYAIGLEFANPRHLTGETSGDTDSQYSENGNSSTATLLDGFSSDSNRLAITDLDNHRALSAGKTLTRRYRI